MYGHIRFRALAAVCLFATLLAVLLPNWYEYVRQPRVHPRALLGHPSSSQPAAWEPLSADFNTSFYPPLDSLHRRQDPNPVFVKSQDRGKKLLCYLQAPHTAPQTPWTDYDELAEWGSALKKVDKKYTVAAYLEGSKKAMTDSGLSVDTPPNINYQWSHSIETEHDGTKYPPTDAKYINVFNAEQGAIVSWNNFGPDYSSKHKPGFPKGAPLPELQQWSDVMFLTWASNTTPETRTKLRYIIRQKVINDQTTQTISLGLKYAGVTDGSVPPWPGHKFVNHAASSPGGRDNAAFEALLGTPNMNGIAWLLIQHYNELGRKTIGSATVWNTNPEISILVELVPAMGS